MALDLERIEEGEGRTTEFKRIYTDEIKKTIVAFANTAGGMLYIGINDDKSIVGVDNPDDTLLQVTNVVRSAIKPDLTLFVDARIERVRKAAVVVVTVQKGTACPYYLAGKGIRPEGVYVRLGASSIPASDTVIISMMKETNGAQYEEVCSLNQDLTFSEAGHFFKLEKMPFGPSQKKTLRLQTSDGVYTNLGYLLSDQSMHTIKMAVFEGLEKKVFQDRREFSGSLLSQLRGVSEHLDIYNHIHAEVKGIARLDKRDYPEEAIREALLNALVHRDYSFSSGTLINIFDDRIEFVSPGGLPKGISLDDIMLGLSVLRNENLANVFYRLRLVEAYGTGIPRIMYSYADCAAKPVLQATSNAFKVTLPNRNAARPETPVYNAPFNESEEKIIALFEARHEIVRKDVEAALNISQAMAVRLLRSLLDKGAIRARGGGKNTRYERRS